MPLPNPKSNESEKDFIGRCISDISKEKDGKGNKRWPDNEQRVAVCYSQWEKKNESPIINKIDMILNESTVVADVAQFQKPLAKKEFIKKENVWFLVVAGKEIDSDESLEKLKERN